MKLLISLSETKVDDELGSKVRMLLDVIYKWVYGGDFNVLGAEIDKQVAGLGIKVPTVTALDLYRALEMPYSEFKKYLGKSKMTISEKNKYTSWTEEPELTTRFLQKQQFGIVLEADTHTLAIVLGLSEFARYVYKSDIPNTLHGLNDLIAEKETIARGSPKSAKIAGFLCNSDGFTDLLDELDIYYEMDDNADGAYVSMRDYLDNQDEFDNFFEETQ